ncbi:microtubule-associated protein 4-like isoform X3 [Varroa jacobsoni]|uniref:microtubule-associated protein 4-like isoform X3 n=1 Tax=Varroa jacobsoni TaxID=62625 RepID=UPI000BF5B431|nr:microtubule-associated protein 4-like isoform X3 [Varroa jacobsoni]
MPVERYAMRAGRLNPKVHSSPLHTCRSLTAAQSTAIKATGPIMKTTVPVAVTSGQLQWNNGNDRNNDNIRASMSICGVPPKKVEIGIAPPPNIAEVKSRIGSMDNVKHKPQGGNVKVETQKLDWSANSRVGSMQNANYRPGGGEKKIMTQKVLISAQSKIGSLDNATHKPGGGNVKSRSDKPALSNANRMKSFTSKISSKAENWILRKKHGLRSAPWTM